MTVIPMDTLAYLITVFVFCSHMWHFIEDHTSIEKAGCNLSNCCTFFELLVVQNLNFVRCHVYSDEEKIEIDEQVVELAVEDKQEAIQITLSFVLQLWQCRIFL